MSQQPVVRGEHIEWLVEGLVEGKAGFFEIAQIVEYLQRVQVTAQGKDVV